MIINSSKIYASSLSDTLNSGSSSLTNSTDISSFVTALLNLAIPLSVVCVVVLLVFAGYQLMTSAGNPDKLKESKEVITNAIIGFLVVLMSVAILLLISNIFDLPISGV